MIVVCIEDGQFPGLQLHAQLPRSIVRVLQGPTSAKKKPPIVKRLVRLCMVGTRQCCLPASGELAASLPREQHRAADAPMTAALLH